MALLWINFENGRGEAFFVIILYRKIMNYWLPNGSPMRAILTPFFSQCNKKNSRILTSVMNWKRPVLSQNAHLSWNKPNYFILVSKGRCWNRLINQTFSFIQSWKFVMGICQVYFWKWGIIPMYRGIIHFSTHFSTYCRVPPSQGLKVTVAWGHGWKAPQTRGDRTLAEDSNLKLPTNNSKFTLVHTDYYSKTVGVGRDNINAYMWTNVCRGACGW